jgi:hypothetical protein
LQILAYAVFTLAKWFETITKPNLTLNQPNTMTFGQRKKMKFIYEPMAHLQILT